MFFEREYGTLNFDLPFLRITCTLLMIIDIETGIVNLIMVNKHRFAEPKCYVSHIRHEMSFEVIRRLAVHKIILVFDLLISNVCGLQLLSFVNKDF
jgi:hypothetical protein